MVVVRLTGGLGNQLFQYAAGLAVAVRNGATLALDLDWYENVGRTSSAPRTYELEAFDIRARRYRPPLLRRLLRRPIPNAFDERHFHFDPQVDELGGDVYLRGHFQTERYFGDAEAEVRRDLSFRAPATGLNAQLLAELADVAAVSVHVRRGDYVSDPATREWHGSAGLEYYGRAVELIAERVESPAFYVFSDDPAWCRENLGFGEHRSTYVDVNPPERSSEDLRLMAACRHHIIANSTFSWWGAWLNPSPSKIVVAPRGWFVKADIDTSDVVPDRWVRL